MAAKPTVTTFHGTGELDTESLSSRSPSIFRICRRPLSADSGDHGDPGGLNSEPLLTKRRPDNAAEQSAKHWYKISISRKIQADQQEARDSCFSNACTWNHRSLCCFRISKLSLVCQCEKQDLVYHCFHKLDDSSSFTHGFGIKDCHFDARGHLDF
jgi:hypothetical protein